MARRHDKEEKNDQDKSLPFSDDAERGILSCLMQNPSLIPEAVISIPHEHFYHPANRLIYGQLLEMHEEGAPIDLVSISSRFLDKDIMSKVGGAGAVAELLGFIPTTAHFPYYKGILRDKYWLRTQITTCTEIIASCYDMQDDQEALADIIDQNIAKIKGVVSIISKADETISDMVDETMDEFQDVMSGNRPRGFTVSWPSYRDTMGSIEKAYHVLKGDPGTGKSAYLVDMIRQICVDQREPAAVFSYEINRKRYILRLVCNITGIPSGYLFHPDLHRPNREQLRAISDAFQLIRSSPLHIYDSSPITIRGIRSRVDRLVEKYGTIGMVGVDYTQRVNLGADDRNSTHERKVAEISDGLMSISNDYEAAVFALTHMNDQGKSAYSKSLEKDAHIIFRLFNYGLKCEKNRDGPGLDEILPIGLFGSDCFRFTENMQEHIRLKEEAKKQAQGSSWKSRKPSFQRSSGNDDW